MTSSLRSHKLQKLVEIEGFASLEDLLQAALLDAVCPAICMSPDCNYTTEMEPDQRRGWCDECRANSMKSAMVLAGIV